MKSHVTARLAIHVTLACLLVCAAGCGKKVDLKLQLKKGDKQSVHIVQTTSTTPSADAPGLEMGSTTEITYTFDVQDVDAIGDASVKATFDQAEQNSFTSMGSGAMPGFDMNALTGGVGKAMKSVQGDSFSLKLASDGKVSGVQGMSAISKKVADKLEVPEGPMKAMLKPMLQQQIAAALSDAAMEKQLNGALAIYPPTPVRVNESWTLDSDASEKLGGMMDVNMKSSRKLTLKSIQGSTATIEVASTISGTSSGAGAVPNVPIKFNVEITGDETGSIDVDIPTGWIKRTNTVQKINSTVKIEGAEAFMPPDKAKEGIKMSFEIKSVVDSAAAM